MAVFGTEEAIPACINWQKVFEDAGVNGVSAICYEAVKKLPKTQQPPFELMLRWDVSALGLQQGFGHRHNVTEKFRELLEQHGLRMLLLKGETLADNYPDPSLRECGDVDFIALKSESA
ncbi:MAG: nucleotidyltransferase family protein, partial [Bacteroidales bacterium]|nr:nucleotidyltransferase family protein [Bacteroidales bacterium]